MQTIPFPSSYKKALINQTKNTTIRLGDEIGKSKVGQIYHATTYKGKFWGIKIKITKIIRTKVEALDKYGIPQKSINSIIKKEKLTPASNVEIIKFEYLS